MGPKVPFLVLKIFINKTLMDIRKVIRKVLSEADVKTQNLPSIKNRAPGAEAAIARAQHLQSKVEKNLSSMGVYGVQGYMAQQGIFSVDMIKNAGNFNFSFQIKGGAELHGKASYNKKMSSKLSTICLNFKAEDGVNYGIVFEKNSLKRPFMAKSNIFGNYKGDYRALLGLQEDFVFTVKMKEEGEKPIVETIKITEIGIELPDTSTAVLFSKDKPIKVVGNISLSKTPTWTVANTMNKIHNNLIGGNFYARLSKKDSNTIILSTTRNEGGDFLVIESQETINDREPQEWSNIPIKINKAAMGNYDWVDAISGTVNYLRPTK